MGSIPINGSIKTRRDAPGFYVVIGFVDYSILGDFIPAYYTEEYHYDSDDEQDVDETAHGHGRYHTKDPKDDEDGGNCV